MRLKVASDSFDPAINSVILYDADRHQWLHFHSPIQVLIAEVSTEVLPLLSAVQQQIDRGYYAAGFVGYEAAPAFDSSFEVNSDGDFPLAWFGIYTSFNVISLPNIENQEFISSDWTPSISRQQYRSAIAQIKNYIAQGLTYQVNFSFRLQADFSANPWLYFTQLIQAQNCSYGAFVNLEDWAICCASPELFFHWNKTASDDRLLTCRPMKGTQPRGLSAEGDRQLAEVLQTSEKNQAENLMIVDMIRNDLGRIARIGTVQVPELFHVEQYPTLWQMTSAVQCSTSANLVEIFRSLFPCASITGAPKTSTMRIIAELEDSPRRIYTGAIGFVTPKETAQFNVAIRTVLIDRRNQTAEYGVGGGIVWDSIETDEFDECCTKAKILTLQQPTFELLESLLWTPENQYFLIDFHLQRLQQSAAYFAFPLDLDAVRDRFRLAAQNWRTSQKVRLLVSKGSFRLEATPFNAQAIDRPLRVGIAKSPVNSADVFLYHKTTQRRAYEQARQDFPELDDVLLWNENAELTESCIANLIVELEGQWYTPPVTCGLLAGTFRRYLLQQEKVKERIIRLVDLPHCSRIFLANSVRQIQAAIVENFN